MAEYKISEVAKQDLIRIHRYGTMQFGEEQADKLVSLCTLRLMHKPL